MDIFTIKKLKDYLLQNIENVIYIIYIIIIIPINSYFKM